MTLTSEHLQAADQGPVTVKSDGRVYVLLSRNVYERLTHDLSDEALSPVTVSGLIREAMAEDDANDPLLDSYQHYQRNS